MMSCGCSRMGVLNLRQVLRTAKLSKVICQSKVVCRLPQESAEFHTLMRKFSEGHLNCFTRTFQSVHNNSYSTCMYLCTRKMSTKGNAESDTKIVETNERFLEKEEASVTLPPVISELQENSVMKKPDIFDGKNESAVTTANNSLDTETLDTGEITETGGEIIQAEPAEEKHIVKPVFNLAALVNKSETLSNFMKLGVDLSVVEKDRDAANLMIHLDFKKDIQPLLFYLYDLGIADKDLGPLFTHYPMILEKSQEELQSQVNYLKSKNFTDESVARIVTKAPKIFSLSVPELDSVLGVYQRTFKLTGDEVRLVFTRLPKLFMWSSTKVKDVKFYMREFLGFSLAEIKQIFIIQPKILLSDKHQLGKRFDYLYNEMKISHHALVMWPQIFRTRLCVMRERHQYLEHLGRAQYDPEKENYVALKALVSGKDRDFCFHVAKSGVAQYNDFLKTM